MLLGQPLGLGQLLGNRPGTVQAQVGIIGSGAKLIIGNVLGRQRTGISEIAPGKERTTLHGDALVKILDFIRLVTGEFGERSRSTGRCVE